MYEVVLTAPGSLGVTAGTAASFVLLGVGLLLIGHAAYDWWQNG